MNNYIKYPRTFHLPYSECITNDDKKLVKLGIEFNKKEIDKNGDLTIWLADEFYEIWKQLIVKANPNISIKRIKLKPFCSKCSGYGIYI